MVMTGKIRSAVGIVVLWVASTHCTSKSNDADAKKPVNIKTIQSDKAYLASSSATDEEIASRAKNNNEFAFALYSKLVGGESDNFLISPLSIQSAFALLFPGSANAAEAELSQALRFKLPQVKFHDSMKGLMLRYLSLGKSLAPGTNFEINITNDVWLDEGIELQAGYLDTIKTAYNAGVNSLDFAGHAENSRQTINDYIATRTKDRITDLLPPGQVTALTKIVLTNAISFLADWKFPFEKRSTVADDNFTTVSGEKTTVAMMNQVGSFSYYESASYQAVSLPYADPGIAMMIVLPKPSSDLSKVEAGLDATEWDKIVKGSAVANVALSLPKFSFKSGTRSLKKEFEQMGLHSVFQASPDNFPKLINSKPPTDLYIQDIFHKTFVRVDEKGTEAAAATAIIIGTLGMPPAEGRKTFRVDHPAMFFLYEAKTGAIAFIGHLVRP